MRKAVSENRSKETSHPVYHKFCEYGLDGQLLERDRCIASDGQSLHLKLTRWCLKPRHVLCGLMATDRYTGYLSGCLRERCELQVHSVDEVEEFLAVADALVINVGTLSREWVESMQLAAKVASKLGKPWVLDPVGAGATEFRTQVRFRTQVMHCYCQISFPALVLAQTSGNPAGG